jgi:hypothetical protein
VFQVGDGLRLNLETADKLRIVGIFATDNLDRYFPADGRLDGPVDGPVGAFADLIL